MGWYEYLTSGKLSRFYDKIKVVAKENGKKPFPMFADLVWCFLRYGAGLADYVNFKFYNLDSAGRKSYVTTLATDKFYETLSPSKYKTFFTNKANFLQNFSKYIPRDYWLQEQGEEALEAFLSRHEEFIQKPIDGLGGHGVHKVKRASIEDPKAYYEELIKGNCLLEEVIQQHEDVSKLNPSSVNTLRICSYANNGESYIWYTCMRIGNGESEVDNFHQGGLSVYINKDTGRIEGTALDKAMNEYEYHPKTGVKFDGYQIPNWDYITHMVKEAALVNPHIHAVGWDVAVTPDGATFVEGNRRPGWDLIQTTYRKGGRPIYDSVMKRYKEDEAKKHA